MQDQNQVRRQLIDSDSLSHLSQKRYFTIGEVSSHCGVKPHVLRYWEQEFPQLSPSKRRGNRRYYQYKELLTIQKIHTLLYKEGYTISGARQYLTKKNKQKPIQEPKKPEAFSGKNKIIDEVIVELQQLLTNLS